MHAISRETLEIIQELRFQIRAAAALDSLLTTEGWSTTEKATFTELHKRTRGELMKVDERLYKQIKAFDDLVTERQQQNGGGQE